MESAMVFTDPKIDLNLQWDYLLAKRIPNMNFDQLLENLTSKRKSKKQRLFESGIDPKIINDVRHKSCE